MNKELIETLETTMKRIMANKLSSPIRPIIKTTKNLNRHSIIIGPRGTGKTTFMLFNVGSNRILYFSADDFSVPANSIHEIASDAFAIGYEGVFIDEVHFDSNWERALKSLYDKYEDKMIWASDSSSLRLRAGIGETARRYIYHIMPLMSFREYLQMTSNNDMPIIENPFEFKAEFKIDSDFLFLFEQYKKEGFLPIFMTGDYDDKVKDIITKIISSDIPYFLPEIKSSHMLLMKEIMRYLASGSVPRIKTEHLTKEWNISYEKLIRLLFIMQETGLITIVPEYGDTKEKFSKSKVFLTNPSMYRILGGKEGNMREALTALAFKSKGFEIYASRNEEEGDFVVLDENKNPITIEVGGKSKSHKKSDYVVRDNIDYPSSHVIPLWALAMMW